jgi:predicted transcriptional regulator
MSTSTTVRLSVAARGTLASLAAARGQSQSAQLEEIIGDAWWQWAMATEREARKADAGNPVVAAERELWEEAGAGNITALG